MNETLHALQADFPKPGKFNWPFYYEPHPLSVAAADELKRYVAGQPHLLADAERGKMFGVLVVEMPSGGDGGTGQLGFLAAYSGLLAGRNDWTWFVPPVFDAQQPDGHFKQEERRISAMNDEIELLASQPEPDTDRLETLRQLRRQSSEALQLWLFRQYRFLNARGEAHDLVQVWQDYHCSARIRKKYPLPPGGTGDCCAPKLLQEAYRQGLKPVCMAEFWWGASPKAEVRHHFHYYPACRGKCKPVLTWMLQGLDVEPDPELQGFPRLAIDVVYEDDSLMVIGKPSGLLSVPGRQEQHSVASIVAQMSPGAIPVHRLDMGTSGLLVVAKNLDVHRVLQEQFVRHTVVKRYEALLEGVPERRSGRIELPLLSDPMNRPRQVVDYRRGKTAVTEFEVVAVENGHARIALSPHTGRTHQLRVHCAHQDGLGCPIVGDELYGTKGERLLLHAGLLEFDHPVTGCRMHFELPPEF